MPLQFFGTKSLLKGVSMTNSLRKTPLHAEHLALGAKMVDFAGYEMPVQYAGIIEEHHATRNEVGIFDVSHMGEFRVSGPGSFMFLQNMLTNDLSRIDECGSAQYTLLLNDEGHILDDLIVYNTGLEYLIIANASNSEKDFAWLEAHKPDDVTLIDESDRTALIAVQGPGSSRIISELAGPNCTLPKHFHLVGAKLDDKIDCLIARTGYTGEDGFELLVHTDDAVALWRLLLSFPEVTPVGLGARDTLRLEMGYHLYGNDMDETRDPISAGLGWVVPKDKVGYIGADVIAAIRENGPSEKLVHLKVEGGIPRHGYPLSFEGKEVGTIASGSHSPTLGIGLATAYVPSSLAQVGTVFSVAIRKRNLDAVVVKPPFLSK